MEAWKRLSTAPAAAKVFKSQLPKFEHCQSFELPNFGTIDYIIVPKFKLPKFERLNFGSQSLEGSVDDCIRLFAPLLVNYSGRDGCGYFG